MSMPSSSPAEPVVEVDAERDPGSLTLHCSSSWIMRTSLEISRVCDVQHCIRVLAWRCMRMIEAEARQYTGRSACEPKSAGNVSSSLGGVGGPAVTGCERDVLMKRFCPPMSWARSPIVHGGGVGGLLYEYGWLGDVGMDVGEQFMKARSASCSASDGEGAAKEKSRKSAVMVVGGVRFVVCVVEQVLCDGRRSSSCRRGPAAALQCGGRGMYR
jgi:hypothetical protein